MKQEVKFQDFFGNNQAAAASALGAAQSLGLLYEPVTA
jgi:hypothetical protein